MLGMVLIIATRISATKHGFGKVSFLVIRKAIGGAVNSNVETVFDVKGVFETNCSTSSKGDQEGNHILRGSFSIAL